MRVVVLEKNRSSAAYKIIKILGWVSAVLAVVTCVLMVLNRAVLNRSDPVHSASLEALIEQLNQDPRNEELRKQIQEMDLLGRKAFFTSQEFNHRGIYLLVGSLVVMLACFKLIDSYEATHPFPDSSDPKDDPREQAKWARKSVTVTGLCLAGFALSLALPWQSPLDESLPSDSAEVDGPPAPAGAGAETASSTPAAPAIQVASAEQIRQNWAVFLGRYDAWMDDVKLPEVWNGETGEGIVVQKHPVAQALLVNIEHLLQVERLAFLPPLRIHLPDA